MITKDVNCTVCGSSFHYQTFCPKKKKTTLKSKSVLKRSTPKLVKSTDDRKSITLKLDRVFSSYIRQKYAINGLARCVTCGDVKPWQQMQNGHFISRRKLQTRWDEMNCHVQCKNCNEMLHGNLVKYEQYIYKKYGPKVVFHLREKANTINKLQTFEIRALLAYYEKALKELENGISR